MLYTPPSIKEVVLSYPCCKLDLCCDAEDLSRIQAVNEAKKVLAQKEIPYAIEHKTPVLEILNRNRQELERVIQEVNTP